MNGTANRAPTARWVGGGRTCGRAGLTRAESLCHTILGAAILHRSWTGLLAGLVAAAGEAVGA